MEDKTRKEKPSADPEGSDARGDAPQAEQAGNALTRLYDKLPISYRHVDIAVKVLIGLILVLVIYGVIKGNM